MVDAKKLKEVSASFSATATTVGAFPAPVVDGSPVSLKASGEGVLYATLIAPDGTLQVTVLPDSSAAPSNPIGIFIEGIYRSTLPTYANGDAAVFHTDSRGRLLVQLSGPGGNTNVIGEDGTTAPANPDGIFSLAKFEATLPTYTDGDAAVLHTDINGRLLVQLTGPDGNSNVIGEDDAAAPTNPDGIFALFKYQATLPTYTDNDAAVAHADVNGRLLANTQLPASTSDVTSVAASASNVTLLSANADRKQAMIFNDSSANLYVKFGTTASTTSFTVRLGANDYYELPSNPIYTGQIDGIWDSATGDARITELEA